MIKAKKGGEKILSLYWFLIITIVAGGLVYITAQFYGEPYDVRNVEEEILSQQVANCLTQENYLKAEVLSLDKDGFNQNNFLEKCYLNFNTESNLFGDSLGEYYLNIEIFNFVLNSESHLVLESPLKSISIGESRLLEQTNLYSSDRIFYISDKTQEKPKLEYEIEREKLFYVLDEEKNPYVIKIIAVVGKSEKNK